MTTIKITITESSSFDEDMNDKVSRLLKQVANHVGSGLGGTELYRPDGEMIGHFVLDIDE